MSEIDTTQTSRTRLLLAGKSLFAQNGYEQTSTSSIAREAGTSESQLVRYFGGKAGLLEAIFDQSWQALHEKIQNNLISAPTARGALLGLLSELVQTFREDHDLAYIFLFEGRRIRGPEHEVFISDGFRRFNEILLQLLERGRLDGSMKTKLHAPALLSALVGAAEGMIRDRLTAQRLGQPDPFADEDVRDVIECFLLALK